MKQFHKNISVLIFVIVLFIPVFTINAVTITVYLEKPIIIGEPFHVRCTGLPSGSKIKLMIQRVSPPPNSGLHFVWELEPTSGSSVDRYLMIPIGSTLIAGNTVFVTMRYFDPVLKEYLQPMQGVFTNIQYSGVYIEVLYPSRRNFMLDALSGVSGASNSTNIINHLSELYKLESLKTNKNIQWINYHKIIR